MKMKLCLIKPQNINFYNFIDGVAVTPYNPVVSLGEGQRENPAMSMSQNTTNIFLKVDLYTDSMANRIINDRVYCKCCRYNNIYLL